MKNHKTNLLTFSNNITSPIQTIGLGVFDGIHRGHQRILDQCDGLLTFRPHPDIILGKRPSLKLLTTYDEIPYYVPNLISIFLYLHVVMTCI